MRFALSAALTVFALGCSHGPFEVSRVVSPADAAKVQGTKLHAVAVLRGDARAELPAQAIVEATRVRVPQKGAFEYALDPGETVVKDDQGRINGVRGAGSAGALTEFVAGTATFDEAKNAVVGELAAGEQRVPLLPTDRVEVRGSFVSGEDIPLGGHVGETRATSALVFGIALFSLSYVPSFAIAAESSKTSDRGLYVPIAGPWIAFAQRPTCVETNAPGPSQCIGDNVEKLALVGSGTLQALGVLFFVMGLPSRTQVEWPDSLEKNEHPSETKSSLRVEPVFYPGGAGLRGEF